MCVLSHVGRKPRKSDRSVLPKNDHIRERVSTKYGCPSKGSKTRRCGEREAERDYGRNEEWIQLSLGTLSLSADDAKKPF